MSESKKSTESRSATISASQVVTAKGVETTFTRRRETNGPHGRVTKQEIRVYVEYGEGEPDQVIRIRNEVTHIDRRDNGESQNVFVWHKDKPDVFTFSSEFYARGPEGNTTESSSDYAQDKKLSRGIDPNAILAILNIRNDAAAAQFIEEYLPSDLGLQNLFA